MMIKRMTMLAFALGFVTVAAADYTDLTWYKDPVRQILNMNEELNCAAVSPSGKQIALATEKGVVLRYLNDNGQVGDLAKFLNLGRTTTVAFSPDGNYVIGAGLAWVKIVRRGTWTTRTVSTPHLGVAQDLATITQRTEVYAQTHNSRAQNDASFEVIDFATATLLADHRNPVTEAWNGAGVTASPDGTRLHLLWNDYVNHESLLQTYANSPTGRTQSWAIFLGSAHAICVGPDPDHLLVPTGGLDRPLNVIRGSDGAVIGRYNVTGNLNPTGIANSADGRFIVLVDWGFKVLRTISGADVRGLMDPNFVIVEEDVRTHQFDLEARPTGVCLHPTLNVAYVWCEEDKKLHVIRIGLPGV